MQSSQNMSCVLCKCTKLLLKYTNNFKCIDISSNSIECFTPWIKCSKNIQQKLLYIPFYTKEQHFFHWYMYKNQVFLWNCIIRKCLLLPSSFNFEPKINEKKTEHQLKHYILYRLFYVHICAMHESRRILIMIMCNVFVPIWMGPTFFISFF